MSGLPWIKVHADLPDHPKARKLAVLTKNPRAYTHLIDLWLWASIHQPDGDLSGTPDELIGAAARWHSRPEAFAAALRSAGFIDGDGRLHDWVNEQAAHVRRQELDRERKRRERRPSRGLSAGQVNGGDEMSCGRSRGQSDETTHPSCGQSTLSASKNQRVERSDQRSEEREMEDTPPAPSPAPTDDEPTRGRPDLLAVTRQAKEYLEAYERLYSSSRGWARGPNPYFLARESRPASGLLKTLAAMADDPKFGRSLSIEATLNAINLANFEARLNAPSPPEKPRHKDAPLGVGNDRAHAVFEQIEREGRR